MTYFTIVQGNHEARQRGCCNNGKSTLALRVTELVFGVLRRMSE